MVVASHSTFVDSFYLIYAYGFCGCVAKADVGNSWFTRPILKAMNAVLVERESRTGKRSCVRANYSTCYKSRRKTFNHFSRRYVHESQKRSLRLNAVPFLLDFLFNPCYCDFRVTILTLPGPRRD